MFTWPERVWWFFCPYVEVNVKWPVGDIVVEKNDCKIRVRSADPNEHYRPFMEEWIGRQGPDWQWYLANNDAAENRLTIRMRRKYGIYASHIAMMWS